MRNKPTQESWCKMVAALGVDMLIDYGLIKKEDFDRATAIVAEEILVRLSMGDYPPNAKK
jgi:uncharacterized protein YqgQ